MTRRIMLVICSMIAASCLSAIGFCDLSGIGLVHQSLIIAGSGAMIIILLMEKK